jgi:hypothetical protein
MAYTEGKFTKIEFSRTVVILNTKRIREIEMVH